MCGIKHRYCHIDTISPDLSWCQHYIVINDVAIYLGTPPHIFIRRSLFVVIILNKFTSTKTTGHKNCTHYQNRYFVFFLILEQYKSVCLWGPHNIRPPSALRALSITKGTPLIVILFNEAFQCTFVYQKVQCNTWSFYCRSFCS